MTDGSTDQGFQFTFYCDICQQSHTSTFIQAKSGKHSGFLHGLAEIANMGASVEASKNPQLAQALRSSADQMMRNQQQSNRSPAWHQEHDAALVAATDEAKRYFSYCTACKRWVCQNDWDADKNRCVQEATKNSQNQPSPAGIASDQNAGKAAPAQNAVQTASSSTDALTVLKLRLAKGEITIDEFQKLKQIMES